MSKAPLVFVDTNVLLYAVDDTVVSKRDQAQTWLIALWSQRCGRLSTQVLNEYYWNVRKKFKNSVSLGDARAEVRRYQHWQPWLVDHATIESAWAVETRYQVSFWDALLVAAAQHMGCRYLLTEDLQHGQVIDKLQVLSPFHASPDLLGTSP